MKRTKKYISLLIASMLLAACIGEQGTDLPKAAQNLGNLTVYPADAEPRYDIELEAEQTFGDTEEELIGNLRDVAVDDQDRVFISDSDQDNVKVYAANSSFIKKLGRRGEGPGKI